MTDKQWEKIIKKANEVINLHNSLRSQAEEEYERRYGQNPSEWDDDYWIDTVHYGHGNVEISKIKEQAEIHKNRFENKQQNSPS